MAKAKREIKCPDCQGWGQVVRSSPHDAVANLHVNWHETCQLCDGAGVVQATIKEKSRAK